MSREVRVVPEAESNIEEAYRYICQDSPERASRWRAGIEAAIQSLASYSLRYAVIHEESQAGREIREMLFGVYRIYYSVTDDAVTILTVRHGARLPLHPEDLPLEP